MKERPILFNTDMVKAILDGRKTQTRREIKPQPKDAGYGKLIYKGTEKTLSALSNHCPKGNVGDILWVRENFHKDDNWPEWETIDSSTHDTYTYKADGTSRDVKRPGVNYDNIDLCTEGWNDPDYPENPKWKPSIHMPKDAARIWLEIEEISIERLQTISEDDAVVEGLNHFKDMNNKLLSDDVRTVLYQDYQSVEGMGFESPINSFTSLWKSINGSESWEQNPFVWVIQFKVLSTTGRPTSLNSNA